MRRLWMDHSELLHTFELRHFIGMTYPNIRFDAREVTKIENCECSKNRKMFVNFSICIPI